MTYQKVASRYMEADLLGRPNEWLVPLVYEHLLVSLKRAAIQIETNDFEGRAASLQRAGDLLFELLNALDHERGGEIASRLASLYTFLAAELLVVGRSLDVRYLRRLTGLVSDLHETWVQAAEQVAPRGRAPAPSLAALRA